MTVKLPHEKYFEGVLQLRNPTDEIVFWVYDTVKKDDRAVIVKETPVRGGVDLYFSSQKYLQSLGKKLNEKFSGELKTTATLHTVSNTGKSLFRVTVLFRRYNFKKHDIFEEDGEKWQVFAVNRQITIKSQRSGEKKQVPCDYVEKFF